MLSKSTNENKKWSKTDIIGLILGYVGVIAFISWFVEGIIKLFQVIIVPIGISIPIIIFIILIFRESPTSPLQEAKPEGEAPFDYSKMGANDGVVQESTKE